MLQNKDALGRIGKWVAELAPFDITFVARTAIKSQALTNFVAEWTLQIEGHPPSKIEAPWTIYIDGSWCAIGADSHAANPPWAKHLPRRLPRLPDNKQCFGT